MSSMHNFLFYPRLALTNMKKNREIYGPYLCAGGLMAGLLYILHAVGIMVEDSRMAGGDIMQFMVAVCFNLCIVFVFLILFYINSFVMKRRKRELGLFCVLGMEKRHLGFVLFWEVVFGMTASLLAGIAGGALFSQAMFMLLLKLVGLPARLMFTVPLQSVGQTCLIYGVCFTAVLAYDLVNVSRTNPIDLLHSSQEGEREPETRWVTAVLGAVFLAGGYGLAATARTSSGALSAFLPSVLMVMAATYCLFQAGSVLILKTLRKNKRFYYKPENFVAVSGMIYRMKQNAAGLAGICILSTAVLLTLSTCASLYVGEEDILRTQYPREVSLFAGAGETSPEAIKGAAEALAGKNGCELVNMQDFHQSNYRTQYGSDRYVAAPAYDATDTMVYLMPLADYNRLNQENRELAPDEALYYSPSFAQGETADLWGTKYRLKGEITTFDVSWLQGFATPVDQVLFVVPELKDMYRLAEAYDSLSPSESSKPRVSYLCRFDLSGSPQGKEAFETHIAAEIPGIYNSMARNQIKAEFYQLYGSILFVGIFFIALFLTATVLIIYYKQITEGYDDRERFKIMEKVGMSAAEVRRTITRQVLMVFFLPLGMAVIHILVAFTPMCSMLTMFSMRNTRLFAAFTALSILVFGVVYLLVYRLTARTYFKIVRE